MGPLLQLRPALLVLILLVPMASAQTEWPDAAGDHEVGHTPYNQFDDASYAWTPGSTTGWYPVVDLRKVSILEETPDTITFQVEVAGDELTGSEPHPVDFVRYLFTFRHHGLERAVELEWYLEADEAFASLRTIADNRSRIDEGFEAERLTEAAGWKVVIPKFRFRDTEKIPLRVGDVLENIQFRASTALWSTVSPCFMRQETPPSCWKARDDIEGGASLGEYEVSRAPAGVGHLELTSLSPLRSSNGLATTYIFELILHNLGDQPDAAIIGVGNYPTDWTISAPAYIQVPPRSRTTFPIAVSVPFTHLHGNETFVNITATSERDPKINAVQPIGVVWTKIPQPSGHHPDLYLHADANNHGWINTLLSDEESVADGRIDTNYYSARFGAEEEEFLMRYRLALSPRLESGLDFDRGDKIQVKLPIEFYHAVQPTISAKFVVENQGQLIAEIGSTTFQANAVAANTAALHEFTVPINETGDRIPPSEEQNLMLVIEIAYVRPASAFNPLAEQEEHKTPMLLTADSYVRLPLVEYIDVVDETLLASLTKFSVTALTDTYKVVNPGRVATFGVEIDNRGDGDTLEWRLIGANPEWATIYPEALNVPGGGNATVVVDVTAPELASEGENMNALLIGQSRDDPNSQVLVRLVAQVTLAEDVPDETPLSQKFRGIAAKNEAGAPGLGFIAVLAGCLAAVWVGRR